jgi:hypothetical protein
VQRALAALDELDFPRGEQAMMWAEWAPERRSPDAMETLSMTPAMAAGVENSLWSLQELVERTSK